MKILEINDVSFRYKNNKTHTLKNINHSFEKGKISSIVGESGAGKTTLLMLLAGLDSKYSGEIRFNGVNIINMNRNDYRARHIGLIYQNYNLLTNATALDNVRMGLYLSDPRHNTMKRATELLDQVGIYGELQNKRCVHLSGGEQQRVAIARTLAGNRDVILADEPTGNLDEKNEATVLNLFGELAHKRDKCVILVTHSSNVSSRADEVFRLQK